MKTTPWITGEGSDRLIDAFEHTYREVAKYRLALSQEARTAIEKPRPITESLLATDFPVLSKYNIPLDDGNEIEKLMRDLKKLSDKVKSVRVYSFDAYNDVRTNLVKIPQSIRWDLFQCNARKNDWVTRVLDSVIPQDTVPQDPNLEVEEDDELGLGRDDAARWLLTYPGETYPDEFAKVAEKIGMPVHAAVVFRVFR